MKGYNRLEQIMDYLKGHNLVTVDQLVAITDASPARRRALLKRGTPLCLMPVPR